MSNLKESVSSNEDFAKVRGHIVPGCSQIHKKSSDSENLSLSEEDLYKRRNSKWRTSQIPATDGKNIIMEKFESSLKKRLLNSTHFCKQVPIFDGSPAKERHRMKTPTCLHDSDLSKNESVFNAVFPARKETGKNCHSPLNEELLSKHNRESRGWLEQLEATVDFVTNTCHKLDIAGEQTEHSKMIKSTKRKTKKQNTDKNSQNEVDSGPLEQLKFLSSPRLLSKVGERGTSRSKIARDKYSNLRFDSGENSRKSLSEVKSDECISRIKNETTKDIRSDDNIKDEIKNKSIAVSSSLLSGSKSVKSNRDERVHRSVGKYQRVVKSAGELSKEKRSNKIKKDSTEDVLTEIRNVAAEDIEGNCTEIKPSDKLYGDNNFATDKLGINRNTPPSTEEGKNIGTRENMPSFDNSLKTTESTPECSLANCEYKVLYFQTERDESQEYKNNSTELSAENSTLKTDDHVTDISSVKKDASELDNKTLSQGEEEEDCTAEPCNEPGWFEEYGIDKKSRKGKEDEFKSDESESEQGGMDEELEVEAWDDIMPQLHDGIIDVETKKKKHVKKRPTVEDLRTDDEDADSILKEVKELESNITREIKTVPLVTLDEVPQKERSFKEKPASEMPMEYLKKYIGKHLAAGLAQVALMMPRDPVDFLAHWLIKQRCKENLLVEMKEFKAEIKKIRRKNIDEMRKKIQMSYLQDEAMEKYRDGKEDALYPTFDSSEQLESDGKTTTEDKLSRLEQEE